MRQYILHPQRHARPGKPPTEQQRAAELRAWKRATIRGLKKFPQAYVVGFEDGGIRVSLPSETDDYLRALQRELDCTWTLARDERIKDWRDLLASKTP